MNLLNKLVIFLSGALVVVIVVAQAIQYDCAFGHDVCLA